MAKKSKRKGRAWSCLSCGRKMKRKQASCKCGWMRPGGAAVKSAAAAQLPAPGFISKAYGANVVPISQGKAARTCWNGHPPGRRGDRYCFTCGEPFGISFADHSIRQIRKAAGAGQSPAGLLAQVHACVDPGQREMIWAAYQASLTGGRPA